MVPSSFAAVRWRLENLSFFVLFACGRREEIRYDGGNGTVESLCLAGVAMLLRLLVAGGGLVVTTVSMEGGILASPFVSFRFRSLTCFVCQYIRRNFTAGFELERTVSFISTWSRKT